MTPLRQDQTESFFSYAGLALLCVLFLPFPTQGKLQLSEGFVPVLLWRLWQRRGEVVALLRKECLALLFAGAWMALAVCVHLLRGEGVACFDFAVLAYMAALFFYYRVTPLPKDDVCLRAGLCVLLGVFLGWLLSKACADPGGALGFLLYHDKHFARLDPNALVTRYQFLFSNPNLLGGAYILPALLCLPALQERLRTASFRQFLLLAFATLIALLPLLATASKMSVMTFGLLLGAFALWPRLKPLCPRLLAAVLLHAFGLLCLITVIFQTYPALRMAPWVNFHGRGNYSVHQEIYARIFLEGNWADKLFGHTPGELRRRYTPLGNPEKIRAILEPYGFEEETPLYSTFMDPHNEYLNLLSFFGLPALAAVLLFLAGLLLRATKNRQLLPLALMLSGVLFAFFWEDAASKRFLWAALGIAAQRIALVPAQQDAPPAG